MSIHWGLAQLRTFSREALPLHPWAPTHRGFLTSKFQEYTGYQSYKTKRKSSRNVLIIETTVEIMATSANLDVGARLIVEECPASYNLTGVPDVKREQPLDASAEEGSAQGVAMGMKFILPNRFDMNVCSRFVKSLNEEDSKNIQDQVNSDLEVASVLFKAECNIHTSPSPGIQVRHVYTPSTTKHFSPIKQSTTLTNKHRGNEVSTTPLLANSLSVHQLAAQGEMLYLATRIEQENVINHTDEEGFTPLMWAAAHGQIAVVEFLLQNGADPQLLGKGRESALSLACSKGYTDIVKMLLDCGVDVNEYDWKMELTQQLKPTPDIILWI